MKTRATSAILVLGLCQCYLMLCDIGWCGTMTSDGWWMRPGDATYEEWTFSGLDPAALNDPFQISITAMVTNQADGGSGYSTAVKVTVTNPETMANQVFSQVWLQNTLPGAGSDFSQTPVFLSGTNKNYSYGYGYKATGFIQAPASLISASGTLKVKIERIPDYQVQDAFGVWNPHVGDSYNQSGITLSAGTGPPPENHSPVANAGPDQSVISIGGGNVNVTLDGSASYDPDPGDSLTYTWTWPGHSASGVNPTISLGPGTYTITLTVTDNGSPPLSGTDTVTIKVVTHKPAATIDSITCTGPSANLRFHKTDSATTISFNGSTSDDQGHGITSYAWRSSIDGVFATTEDCTKNPSDFSPGEHTIYFSCTCSAGATSTEAVYPQKLIISELPALSFDSSTVDWTGASFEAKIVVDAKLANAKVRLDMVVFKLYSGATKIAETTYNQYINPGESRIITLGGKVRWEWDTTWCTCPWTVSWDNGKTFNLKVTAEITDEHGDHPPVLSATVDRNLQISLEKKILYGESFTAYCLGGGETAAAFLALAGIFTAPAAGPLFAAQASHLGTALAACGFAHDPWEPDPNFQQEVFASVPVINPGPICEQDISDYGKCWDVANDAPRLRASLEALYATIPKMLGAAEASDPCWTPIHCADAIRFGVWVAEDLEKLAHSQNEVRKLLTYLTAEDINDFQQQLETSGFPEQELSFFEQLDLNQADINDLRDLIISADPQNVVDEVQTDKEAQIKALSGVFRGMAVSVWPHERLAVAITSPRENGWVKGQVNIEVSGWNTLYYPVVQTTLDVNGLPAGTPPPAVWDTTSIADGVTTLTAAAIPQWGPPAIDTITVTVDNNAPVVTITSPTETTYFSEDGSIPLEYSLQDNLDSNPRVSCVLLNGQPLTTSDIPGRPGSYRLVMKAVDAAGNYAEESVSFDIVMLSDFNRDRRVNFEDFAQIALAWLTETGEPSYVEELDLDQDGDVDVYDLRVFASKWLNSVDSDLVAHWKLDEVTGLTAYDSAGYNNGTLVGDPTWTAGEIISSYAALQFGDANDYVDCNNNPAFNLTQQITVSAWVDINTVPRDWTAIVTKGDSAWRLSTAWSEKRFHFGVAGPPDYASVSGATTVASGEWHHVCGTFDGSTIRIYLDGVEDGNTPYSGPITTNDSNVFIGGNAEFPDEGYRSWDGLIDDVRIYNRPLTAAEVQDLFNEGL
jgi:hypothetical protein